MEWGASGTVEQETVRAAVAGLASGLLKGFDPVPEKTPKSRIHYAPGFASGCSVPGTDHVNLAHPYTAETLKEYIGWSLYKVKCVLRVLESFESEPDLFEETDFQLASTRTAETIIPDLHERRSGSKLGGTQQRDRPRIPPRTGR